MPSRKGHFYFISNSMHLYQPPSYGNFHKDSKKVTMTLWFIIILKFKIKDWNFKLAFLNIDPNPLQIVPYIRWTIGAQCCEFSSFWSFECYKCKGDVKITSFTMFCILCKFEKSCLNFYKLTRKLSQCWWLMNTKINKND